jgi:hypothetical protein
MRKSWYGAMTDCVYVHYSEAMERWANGSLPEPDSWQETLCWAGILVWTGIVIGPRRCLEDGFPNDPDFAEVIVRLRDTEMLSIAMGLELLLKQIHPSPVSHLDLMIREDLNHFDLPMREGWTPDFYYLNGVDVDALRPEHLPVYQAYRHMCKTTNLVEIFRFLEDHHHVFPELPINCDLSYWLEHGMDGQTG